MRHRVQDDVDAHGIRFRREPEEVVGVLPFTLPRVGDVRVVDHQHHEAAARIEPGFALVYFNLSLVYHKLGDIDAASSTLERYRELEPEDEDLEVLNQLLKAMKSGSPFGKQ